MLDKIRNNEVPKIAILIADCHDDFFGEIKKAIHNRIWKPFRDAGYHIFYIKGNKPNGVEMMMNYVSDKLRDTHFHFIEHFFNKLFIGKIDKSKIKVENCNNDLLVDIPEGLRHISLKMLIGMKYLEENDFKIVYRTTISSILSFDNFNKVVNSINNDQVIYKGSQGEHNGIKFVSGANTLIDSKAISILFSEMNKIDFGYVDDVAFSKILWPYIDKNEIPSVSIGKTTELNYLNSKQASEIVHFRCRSYEKPRDDLKIMNYVCEYLRI
jgi:hypothetical protein